MVVYECHNLYSPRVVSGNSPQYVVPHTGHCARPVAQYRLVDVLITLRVSTNSQVEAAHLSIYFKADLHVPCRPEDLRKHRRMLVDSRRSVTWIRYVAVHYTSNSNWRVTVAAGILDPMSMQKRLNLVSGLPESYNAWEHAPLSQLESVAIARSHAWFFRGSLRVPTYIQSVHGSAGCPWPPAQEPS